jgi:hypothetical protein
MASPGPLAVLQEVSEVSVVRCVKQADSIVLIFEWLGLIFCQSKNCYFSFSLSIQWINSIVFNAYLNYYYFSSYSLKIVH